MTKTVLKGTRLEETDYQKGFQRAANKLSNEINKTYSYFINKKLGIEGYAEHCNQAFNEFIKKLGNLYPEPFLKKIYQDHFPLEEVQRSIQDKMEYLKHSRDNLELRENDFEKEVININKSFLKILMGKRA